MVELIGFVCPCCGATPAREVLELGKELGEVPRCFHEHNASQRSYGEACRYGFEYDTWVQGLVRRCENRHGRRVDYASALCSVMSSLEFMTLAAMSVEVPGDWSDDLATQAACHIQGIIEALGERHASFSWEFLFLSLEAIPGSDRILEALPAPFDGEEF